MTTIHICGNFAKEGQCGTCKHFMLWGVSYGACCRPEGEFEDRYCMDTCEHWEVEKKEEKINE